jgi:hypothetical protein
MINRTRVFDGENLHWYDNRQLVLDLDDGRMKPTRRSRLKLTRCGTWVLSPHSTGKVDDPPDRVITRAEAHRWLSERDPIYLPDELGAHGPAYEAYLAKQEV